LQQLGLVSQIKPGLGICQLGHLSSFYKCALEKNITGVDLETKKWH